MEQEVFLSEVISWDVEEDSSKEHQCDTQEGEHCCDDGDPDCDCHTGD